jgi:hypothetical protein
MKKELGKKKRLDLNEIAFRVTQQATKDETSIKPSKKTRSK